MTSDQPEHRECKSLTCEEGETDTVNGNEGLMQEKTNGFAIAETSLLFLESTDTVSLKRKSLFMELEKHRRATCSSHSVSSLLFLPFQGVRTWQK